MKYWSWLLPFTLLPQLTLAFSDIAPTDPQVSVFQHLQDVGIMRADLAANFNPENIVTRAEALTIALRAGGIQLTEYNGESIFADVDPNSWFAPIVARAAETKIINTKNQFLRPDQAVSKAEFLAFLFRATRVNFDGFFNRTKNLATDIPSDAWFAPHFAYAKKYQIAHLPADQFYRPQKALNRREVAVMTYRQLKLFNGNQVTKNFVELQGQIDQFMTLLRANKTEAAESHLQRIVELTNQLAQLRNDENATAAQAISLSINHFADSLRSFKLGRNLHAIENLHLAAKQAQRAQAKSGTFAPFATELSQVIRETLLTFTTPRGQLLSRR
jgi:DNA-binding protein H-NS